MIATGLDTVWQNTEMYDMEGNFKCTRKYGEFPVELQKSSGTFFAGFPVLCGGGIGPWPPSLDQLTDKCWKFENNQWKVFANLTGGPRERSAVFESNGKLVVFAGKGPEFDEKKTNRYDFFDSDGNFLKSNSIIKIMYLYNT